MLCPRRLGVLILLAWLAGCDPNEGFSRPAVLARDEGEARMLQGRSMIASTSGLPTGG